MDYSTLAYHLERSHTRRIALRPVTLTDAWPLYQATRNPSFNRWLLWPQPGEDHQVRQRVERIVEAATLGRMAAVSAVVKDTGEWISLFRFQPFRDLENAMEMGIWTHHRFWHGRYSFELGRLCIDVAFTACPGLERLVGASSPDNEPSCRLMELCGLHPGEVELRATEDDQPLLLREYAVTREQWLASHAHRVSFRRFDDQDHDFFPAPAVAAVAAVPADTKTTETRAGSPQVAAQFA